MDAGSTSPPIERSSELIAEWKAIQRAQAAAAIFKNHDLPFAVPPIAESSDSFSLVEPVVHHCVGAGSNDSSRWRGLEFIGGLDISFRQSDTNQQNADSNKESTNDAIACLAVLSFPALDVLYSITKQVNLSQTPYIPSFLAFREQSLAELVLDLLARPDGRPLPQVLFVDGNGRLHPRQAGSAVSIGIQTGLPTIGVAKEYFPVVPDMTDHEPPLPEVLPCPWLATQRALRAKTRDTLRSTGDWIGLPHIGRSSTSPASVHEYLGAALRSSPVKGGTNPIFVSCGHRVALETALELVLACCVHARVPEPIRQADKIGRAEVSRVWGA